MQFFFLIQSLVWTFVLVYVDDVIVFSRPEDEHLGHLEAVFTILENPGCSLRLNSDRVLELFGRRGMAGCSR